MERSFKTAKLIGALAVGTLAGAVLGVFFSHNKEKNLRKEIVSDTKNLAKNLRKKAQKNAKTTGKEEWLAQEKDKIMNHAK